MEFSTFRNFKHKKTLRPTLSVLDCDGPRLLGRVLLIGFIFRGRVSKQCFFIPRDVNHFRPLYSFSQAHGLVIVASFKLLWHLIFCRFVRRKPLPPPCLRWSGREGVGESVTFTRKKSWVLSQRQSSAPLVPTWSYVLFPHRQSKKLWRNG